MLSHEKSIMQNGRYLLDMRKQGIIYKPDKNKGLECYVNADFPGAWSQADADNSENVLSCTGYVLMYANCPILWVSRLQTEIVLSTAEAEYIALSQALRDVIPLITLLKEINKVFPVHVKTPTFICLAGNVGFLNVKKMVESTDMCVLDGHVANMSVDTSATRPKTVSAEVLTMLSRHVAYGYVGNMSAL